MNVRDSVIACLRNWPSLHKTRLDSLMVMFDYSGATWENGERINQPSTETASGDYPQMKPFDTRGEAFFILNRKRDEAEQEFTIENAELIADDHVTGFTYEPGDDCWRPWLIEAVDSMPDDVTEEWRVAAVELAFKVWRATRECPPKTHGHSTHRGLAPFLTAQGCTLLTKEEDEAAQAELAREILADLRERENG